MFWTVHYPEGKFYPDGNTLVHKTRCDDLYLPGLGKIIYNGQTNGQWNFYEIVEISETEMWLERSTRLEYERLINLNYKKYNVAFKMDIYESIKDFSE